MRSNLRRFTDHGDAGEPFTLGPAHPAVQLGTSLYRVGRLRSAAWTWGSVLKSGHNSRKIGSVVRKGRWKGFPIFTLTLEERATCPGTCQHWADCYGNKMNWPTRWMADDDLIGALERSLDDLAAIHQNFVVRLHVLGDFFSGEYVACWERWLDVYPGLHVYGYTAWQPDTDLGRAIASLAEDHWGRFAIRTSNGPGNRRTTRSLYEPDLAGTVDGAIVCPAQTGQTECCATCALCWQTDRPIAFLNH